MRIIGGRLRGRALSSPDTQAIRPTSDRLRETLFNILAHTYGDPVPGGRVIDLFAGTGALGLEALSRGAAHALFVEIDAAARALIRDNVDTLGVGGTSRIFRRDAGKLGVVATDPFRLAFLDPPYGRDLASAALVALRDGGWLQPDAICVVEEHDAADVSTPSGFTPLERRTAGDSQLLFLRYAQTVAA